MYFIRYAIIICSLLSSSYAIDISGIYLTHKGTDGGQSIVEIFKHNGKYYIYGLKNLEANPITDACNKIPSLRNRKSVGNVFGYGYMENKKGHFVGGLIYNFHNCKTYYGKIIPKQNNKIDFVGAIDSYYILSRAFEWQKLTEEESRKYQQYRVPFAKIATTIDDTIKSKR